MPPRKTQQDPPADQVVFGPDLTAPSGAGSATPASPARRPRKGPVEQAVTHDLAPLPDSLRKGGVAAAALRLARELDSGIVMGRDAAGHAREIRQCITVLREWAPVAAEGDKTGEARDRRARRLELVAGS